MGIGLLDENETATGQFFPSIASGSRRAPAARRPIPRAANDIGTRFNITDDLRGERISSRQDIADEDAPVERFISALQELWRNKAFRFRSDVAHRLSMLRSISLEEQTELSVNSVEQFVRFLTSRPRLNWPSLIITPQGNVRASWSPEDNKHFAIEFLGGQEVRFVVFAPREGARPARIAGSELLRNVLLRAQQIGADWYGEHT
jgi:hypothetical protein